MTAEAWYQLSRYAVEERKPWMAPPLQVHDDLTLLVPNSKVDEAIDTLVPIMCNLNFKWVTVPIVVEVKKGPNWGALEKHGEYRSDKLERKAA
jgi:DNA polymerase I-like protein with 3'-5' exonuclease and polymerase domains